MADLTTDSPLSRRIVLSFLDFLNSVKPGPDVDLEGLEVARECLAQVFKLDPSSIDGKLNPDDVLVRIFNSIEPREQQQEQQQEEISGEDDAPTSSSQHVVSEKKAYDSNLSETARSHGEDWTRDPHTLGVSHDELFGQFFAALEKINFFKTLGDEQVLLDKATHIFHTALADMERSGQKFDKNNLADAFKSQGNRAMQSKLYLDAIELYSFAAVLCENNAVYYCNRAAAYTQIHRYNEAIIDCQRSIEIDPHYSKAYSRLGIAYYAQGNYIDAISEGFIKALQLDPNNDSVKENMRMAEQKLKEELQQAERSQSSGSATQNNQASDSQSVGGSRSDTNAPPPFTSIAFDAAGSLPADFRNMFMNMAVNAYPGPHSQDQPEDGGGANSFDEPGIRIDGNASMNFGEQMPEELTGAFRSVMEMFSGAAASHGNPQNEMDGRPAPS